MAVLTNSLRAQVDSQADRDRIVRALWTPETLALNQRAWATFRVFWHGGARPWPTPSWASWVTAVTAFSAHLMSADADNARSRSYATFAHAIGGRLRSIVCNLHLPDAPPDAIRSAAWSFSRAAESAMRLAVRDPAVDARLAVTADVVPATPARTRVTTAFDAARIVHYWCTRPDNADLSEFELRDKVISLHAVDRGARSSSLCGTRRDPAHFRLRQLTDDISELVLKEVDPKGRAGHLVAVPPIVSFPAWTRACTVAATMSYVRRTQARAVAVALADAARTATTTDRRTLPRSQRGGVPLFISVPRINAPDGALREGTISQRLAAVIASATGEPGLTAHSSRHAAASAWARLGLTLEQIAVAGGWASVSVPRTSYIHIVRDVLSPADWATLPASPGVAAAPPVAARSPTSWLVRAPLVSRRAAGEAVASAAIAVGSAAAVAAPAPALAPVPAVAAAIDPAAPVPGPVPPVRPRRARRPVPPSSRTLRSQVRFA